RELPLWMMATEKLLAPRGDQFAQCGPCQRTGGDPRLILTVIANLPTLGIVVAGPQRFAQDRFQPPTAPDVLSQDRLKPQRIQRLHGNSFTLCRTEGDARG